MIMVNVETILQRTTLPVIVAPMFLVSSTELVIEACKAGTIGTFPLLNARTTEDLEQWMKVIVEELKKARIEQPDRKIAPWGINLIVHKSNKRLDADIELLKEYKPPIVITSLGNPEPIVKIVHAYGGLVFSDVVSIKHAKKAAQVEVDGLILVCNGAGGHGGTLNPIAFMAEVKEFWSGITILSGCIANGQDILAAQALGADFAYIGTRFIATQESLAIDEYKQMLVDSDASDIIYTDAVTGINGNYLIPSIQNAGLDLTKLEGLKEYDTDRNKKGAKAWKNIWGAGQGVGSVKDIQPVAKVVEEMKTEYELALQSLLAKKIKTYQ
ncbi:nitronate monooxygenase [Sporosarcina sp. P13]|uniref:NAD(P)H-dependent flavin oxidoreductase n=1 Tax=Sporosarcina sp. P13 TaxID=2048263 RepID=UPI000C163BB7|nr:nitronate monooxygenase [Sporosarcina sp. P13]PIC64921.1 nitronate monooxygenase [Sporosarcina sp. P13]